ncbi:hypothetical protein [Ferrimicrobium acidiphilum]|uniref:Uncharacterized protein n=1 Tax=Ferrimicrobium acidiphilum DSM 19497 TaxID=1121877 RepID=A0A0D8FRU7_9ACTN|nr:hypothetical protein [Ferrimicrobium acidiphilum]KJE75990.1 hypothetical protein FEAC_22870 [Ferrimicrobium acidiphilum DSM 19497]
MDGQRQREVVSALERALRAAVVGNFELVRRGADSIRELNQLALYAELPDVLDFVADRLAAKDHIGAQEAALKLHALLDGGPFLPLVDELIASLSPKQADGPEV